MQQWLAASKMWHAFDNTPPLWRHDGAKRLSAILSRIEACTERGNLADVLETLDSCKPAMFERLRNHFGSDLLAKAVTQKILNVCLAMYHFTRRSVEVGSRPFGLVVDPSNSCNLACPGCVHSQRAKELKLFDWDPGNLEQQRLAGFFERYGPAAIHVILCNYGEPLVNPNTPKFIRIAKRYLLHTMISTNLSLARF